MEEKSQINIEITLAHHEQQITDLNAVITDQWKEIDRLKRALDKVMAKIDQMEYEASGETSDDGKLSSIEKARRDIPPHY